MLIKKAVPRAYPIAPSSRRRLQRRLFLACLPLSGLLLILLICSLVGAGISLLWLTAPAETNRITRIRQLPPLPLLTMTPTTLPLAITAPSHSEPAPADPASPPPATTPSSAPLPPTATPMLQAATASTPIPPPASPSTVIPTASSGESFGPTATAIAVPIPEWWQSYMTRIQKPAD